MAAANVSELMASATADDNRELIAQMTDRTLLSDSSYASAMDGSSQGCNWEAVLPPPPTPQAYGSNTQSSHCESELNRKGSVWRWSVQNVLG